MPEAVITASSVVHVDDIPGIGQQGRHIGGQEVLALTAAQQQRGVLPGGDDAVRRVGADDAQGIRALHGGEHTVHRLEYVAAAVVVEAEELGYHLGVRLGAEGVALLDELGLQAGKVLDDAVVDNGEAAVAAGLGMGVDLIGLTVGGPAGVAHAHRAGEGRAVRRQLRQSRQPARRFIDLQSRRAAHRHAGGVVAAVLQTAQAVQQDGGGLPTAHVAYYSTHNSIPPDKDRGRANAQTICLRIRSQPLCFAVTRIFTGCVRARTARKDIRRIFR